MAMVSPRDFSRLLALSFLLLGLPFSLLSAVEASAQREFDYFALALQWPGTICQKTRHCCKTNGCCRSEPLTEFTIHGLWPDYDDGSWPSCCSQTNFDLKKISSLMPSLQQYWPSLYCSSSSLCTGGKGLFWAHEWEKHGTCSYPVIQDEYSYFSTVIDLYSKYNVTRVLNNEGILAANGQKYSLEEVTAAIKNAFGVSPLFICSHGSVEELRLCFSKDFKPRECVTGLALAVDKLNSGSSCPRYVSFPTYAPLGLGDVSGAAAWSAA